METLKLERLPELGDPHPQHPGYECIGYKSNESSRPVRGKGTWSNIREWPTSKDIVQDFIVQNGAEEISDQGSMMPPEVTIKPEDSFGPARLSGWDELKRFGFHQDSVFNRTVCEARKAKLEEVDELRLLVARMLRKCRHQEYVIMERLQTCDPIYLPRLQDVLPPLAPPAERPRAPDCL